MLFPLYNAHTGACTHPHTHLHTHNTHNFKQANTAVGEQHAKYNRNMSLVLSGVAIVFGVVGLACLFGGLLGYYLGKPCSMPTVIRGSGVIHGTSCDDVIIGSK